jgi:hypothetical protein
MVREGAQVTLKKSEGFFVVFFREELPEKTPPAEQPTKRMWASHQLHVGISAIFIYHPCASRQELLLEYPWRAVTIIFY